MLYSRFQPVFLKYKKKNNNCNYLLTLARKEKSSSYSKGFYLKKKNIKK